MKYTITVKTFMREWDNPKIYYAPKLPKQIDDGIVCNCVYNCDQFMTYPTDKWGRRIIPANTKCPNVKHPNDGSNLPCEGGYFCHNGHFSFQVHGCRKPYDVVSDSKER